MEDDNQPSGITIYANGDTPEENEECINTVSKDPKKKMIVDFPGVNAPIPVNANQNRWANPNHTPVSFTYSNNNRPLNHEIRSFSELQSGVHSYNHS